MLEARGLTKYYSAITGVRDVNFRIERGSVLGLLGPNGSGKSTTVGMLTGLLEPSGGTVSLDGADMRDDLLRYKRGLGYVPEEAQLYTWMSGAEYLTLLRAAARVAGRRCDTPHRRAARDLRPPDRSRRPDERLLERHAAEDPAVGGAPPQPVDHHPRRAVLGSRRRRHARRPQPDPAPGRQPAGSSSTARTSSRWSSACAARC